MSIWPFAVALLIAALVPLLWPLLRPPRRRDSRAEHELAVYRAQLEELDREGTESGEDDAAAAEARREIARRLLRAA
ncbi:MAG TPA: c-type cytochrome biogenesis protein CcmI, partial [Alphaproteobacteria bacterium]|nr:c-type cytochrome biogenesis protein CcmI [Alphaproteobacteria bacterium]